jgi:anti-sigma regulatory factor (Ser/Thr protein kinase)
VKPGASQHLTVQPTLPEVARAVETLQAQLPEGMHEHEKFSVAVALAEVLTNIVEHGYQNRGGAPIQLAWASTGRTFVLEVTDAGRPIPGDRLATAGRDTTFGFDPTATRPSASIPPTSVACRNGAWAWASSRPPSTTSGTAARTASTGCASESAFDEPP